MTGKKEYTIKINGVKQSITEVTSLEKALDSLDSAMSKQRGTEVKATEGAKARGKALSEEEKAAKKLADTHARIAAADSEANKAQIAATKALRERTREVTRAVIQDGFAEDSIASMGMQLTDLRLEYERLTAAQRADIDVGGKLLAQIQGLDAEYKALRESTGNFRDSVGNYEKALKGLGDLKDGLDKVRNGSSGLAAGLMGSNSILQNFGQTTETVAIASEGLQGVMSLSTQAAYIYNSVVKDGIIQEKAAAAIQYIRTIQTRAAAAATAYQTKATVSATIAQGAFNLVASANPYVILALAILAVGAALYALVNYTDAAAEKQKELNAVQAAELDQLDKYGEKTKEYGEKRLAQLQTELDVLKARGARTADIRAAEDTLMRERIANNAKLRGYYAREIEDLEANRKKIEQLTEVLQRLNIAKAKGDSNIKIDIDLDGKIDRVKVDEAIDSVQGQIDNSQRKVQIALDVTADRRAIVNEARIAAAARAKEDKDKRKEQREQELADTRALEDARAQLLTETYENRRAQLRKATAREIEDLRIRLATDEELTAKSRAAINANIVVLGKALNKQLADLDKENRAAQLQSAREVIDSRNALILGAEDRQIEELKTRYTRQINDLKTRLKEDATLTTSQQSYITEQIANAAILRERELAAIQAAGLEARANAELARLDDTLAKQRDRITKFTGELQARDTSGLQLINVDATRKNLAEVNAVLDQYVTGLSTYQTNLEAATKATLATLKEGTPEYQAELDKYAKATADNAKKIAQAQKEQADNTRASQNTELEYYRDASEKIAALAQSTVGIFQQGADLFASAIQGQIDALNSALEGVNGKYDEAKAISEQAVQDVENTEAQLQDATGGTAAALKEQLADQMRARNAASREEQRLAKEKEKLEADLRKREKQAKRVELLSNIAQATANGFQAVSQALAAYPPPFSYIAAGITAGIAAVQVAGMTKQLIKLADGGEIQGASHAAGGVPIGLGYEAEGGEFMVNKSAYASNPQLVRFINESTGTITAADLVGLVPGTTQIMTDTAPRNSNEDIVNAIAAINIKPQVSVVEILDVADQITGVQELAGYVEG